MGFFFCYFFVIFLFCCHLIFLTCHFFNMSFFWHFLIYFGKWLFIWSHLVIWLFILLIVPLGLELLTIKHHFYLILGNISPSDVFMNVILIVIYLYQENSSNSMFLLLCVFCVVFWLICMFIVIIQRNYNLEIIILDTL